MNESINYCAFLRGVNVNGTTMKMAEVCHLFTKLGLDHVTSVLASGNILFSSNRDLNELRNLIENQLSDHFQYDAHVFLKSKLELESIVKNVPFQKQTDCHTYVFIADEKETQEIFFEYEKCEHQTNESGSVINTTFYWQLLKKQTLNSEFGKILGKKKFKDKFTSRNINTVEKIVAKF